MAFLKSIATLLILSCNNGESLLVTARAPWSRKTTISEKSDASASFMRKPGTAMPASLSTTSIQQQRESIPVAASSPTYPSNRAKIEVSSEIELPFSADVAFDAFADLRRQPTYSTWLNSVEYLDGSPNNSVGTKSKWTISVLGFRFSWNSVSLRQDRQEGIIEWGSLSGLQNQGCVQFTPINRNKTHMRLTMTIFMPRFAARVMAKKNQSVSRMIENKMLKGTLERFRDDVLQNDLHSPLVDLLGEETSLDEEANDRECDDHVKDVLLVDLVDDDSLSRDLSNSEFRPVVPQD